MLNPNTAELYPTSTTDALNSLAFDSSYVSSWADKYWKIDFLKLLGIDLTTNYYYG